MRLKKLQAIAVAFALLCGHRGIASEKNRNNSPNHNKLLALMAESAELRSGLLDDINFLIQNVSNCSSHGDKVKEKVLLPAKKSFESDLGPSTLTLASLRFPQPSSACFQTISAANFSSIHESAQKILTTVSQMQAELQKTRTILFTTDTGDGFLTKVFSASSDYPLCVPQAANNPNSTKEGLHYIELKERLNRLGAVAQEIKVVADAISLLGEATCANSVMVAGTPGTRQNPVGSQQLRAPYGTVSEAPAIVPAQ